MGFTPTQVQLRRVQRGLYLQLQILGQKYRNRIYIEFFRKNSAEIQSKQKTTIVTITIRVYRKQGPHEGLSNYVNGRNCRVSILVWPTGNGEAHCQA